jgi:hypothetical protein
MPDKTNVGIIRQTGVLKKNGGLHYRAAVLYNLKEIENQAEKARGDKKSSASMRIELKEQQGF